MAKNKPFTFPKTKVPNPVTKQPMMTPEEELKQYATKPVVKPPRASNRNLTKPLKSYLP